jgi:hypothetical protein
MSVSIDKDELRSEIEFRLTMADVPQEHIKIATNSMEDLISAQITTLLNKLEAQAMTMYAVTLDPQFPQTYKRFERFEAIPLSAIHKLRRELNGDEE